MLKEAPNKWTLEGLHKACDGSLTTQTKDGRSVPARPLGYYSMRHRLSCAWLVFTGRADAVVWPQ